jgi:hypothetical protein
LALVASRADILFTKYELLSDSQSSIDIVGHKEQIESERKADKVINMCGIQLEAAPVMVDTVGDFREFGTDYYRELSSANILSFASQVKTTKCWITSHLLRRTARKPLSSEERMYPGAREGSTSVI